MSFLVTLIANMAGLWVAASIIPGLHVTEGTTTEQSLMIYGLLALILTLLNMFIRPIIKFFSLPLYFLTFGAFALVVNAIIIGLVGWISDDLIVSGFFTAVFAGLVTSIVASAARGLLLRLP
ncbi:hypothetical protein BSR29_00605 [Boudabousia liubingyangii]|uniref:Phage holin family protein n=1 Tax=Boudabousia liubingyangii TaxID=1921764 RepID=A0A1Q5PPM8_9ACTO|nr:phage holin family protein [Boudabousia liubingyangii]OKL48474.1 hypothetical protein BSR28_01905 [Boudabousia liubingyangii]OKL49497.1 hypothetical protein BSR29_00605 [Boudabousia liubingyangii]